MSTGSRQALWFVLVGGAAALVHFVVLVALVQGPDVAPALANVGAFCCAFGVSFVGHFRLSFRDARQQRSWLASLWRWLLSAVLGFAANQLLFVLGLHWLGQRWYAGVWLVVTLLVTVLSFALGKFWAFRRDTDRPV